MMRRKCCDYLFQFLRVCACFLLYSTLFLQIIYQFNSLSLTLLYNPYAIKPHLAFI